MENCTGMAIQCGGGGEARRGPQEAAEGPWRGWSHTHPSEARKGHTGENRGIHGTIVEDGK